MDGINRLQPPGIQRYQRELTQQVGTSQQPNGPSSNDKAKKASESSSGPAARMELSPEALELARKAAQQNATQTQDAASVQASQTASSEKTAALRQAVESGTYKPDPMATATRMVDNLFG